MKDPAFFPRGDNYEIAKNTFNKKKSSSPEPFGQFQSNLAQWILGLRGFKFVQMKGHTLFPMGDNYKIAKIHTQNLKTSFPEPLG